MILCVGAVSQRVVEEAAKLRVHQIVASRRQVGEILPGYTGYTSATLAETVRELSDGETQVVRDHGGPYQGGDRHDDWIGAFDADVDAGFDALHVDVCQLPKGEQIAELTRLCERYGDKTAIEVGGERDAQQWLDVLLETALKVCKPTVAVADLGGHIWADRQQGSLIRIGKAKEIAADYAKSGIKLKAHNFDWLGQRRYYGLGGSLYNVAPEFGNVEIDAWLQVMSYANVKQVLNYAYDTKAWRRWFNLGEGTWFERARAALRYHLNNPAVIHVLDEYDDTYVREAIQDALNRG